MPKIQSVDLLACALDKEKKGDWIAAIDFHQKILAHSLQEHDLLNAGEIEERIGYCFHRAAMKAKSRDKFKKKIILAIESYQQAREFYKKLPHKWKEGRELRCKAIATFLNYWLISSGSERRKLLSECLALESKALIQFQNNENMLDYARTYNALWQIYFLKGFLEWDKQALLALTNKGIEWGEKAISMLSELDNPIEIAWAYFTYATSLTLVGSLDNFVGFFILKPEDREKKHLLVTESLNKAMTLAEKLEDSYLKGLIHLWLGFNLRRGSIFRGNIEKALDYSIITQDNLLCVCCLDTLAYDAVWQGWGTPSQRWKGIETAKKFHNKAKHYASIINFHSIINGPISEPYGSAAYYLYKATVGEVDSRKRLDLLNAAENLGIKALKLARDYDTPRIIGGAIHVLSKTFVELAKLDSEPMDKKRRIRKAIIYREEGIKLIEKLEPFAFFDLGIFHSYLAEAMARLAEIETDPHKRRQLLQKAVINEEKSLELCVKNVPYFEKIGQFDYMSPLSFILDRFTVILADIHDLPNPSNSLKKAIEILSKITKSARKKGMLNFVAETYWRIAKAQGVLEEHLEAAKNFKNASENYLAAAKILPQLEDLFESYAVYMQAWHEIEKAKAAHYIKNYRKAKSYYEKAASLHKITIRWDYLSINYLAWANLEDAEQLSRNEKPKEAREVFLKAAKLFEKAGDSIQPKLSSPLTSEEKNLSNVLLKASAKRRKYCYGRIALEEARIEERQGDHLQSSRKYGLAAKIFETIAKGESELSCKQLLSIFYLCQAWQRMMVAEATVSSVKYNEAADLFKKSTEYSLDRETSLLALANVSFCRALASGAEFEITRDQEAYSNAKKHMEAAETNYLKAGYGLASEYAKATLALLDAYMYSSKAEMETEPEEKAKYYNMAEKTLCVSIDSFSRAKRPEKKSEVQRILTNITEKRQLAVSLASVLPDPGIMATTKLFYGPTPTHEKPIGFERFEHAELEANLTISKEPTADEQIEVKLDIVNIGRQTALLLRVKGLIPVGFEATCVSSQAEIEGDLINLKGKRIQPLRVDSIQILIKTSEAGIFSLKPQISYIDEIGNFKQCFPKPVNIMVHPKLELEFRTNAAQKVFEYLSKSFMDDYMRRKLALKESGWRSLVQVMKNTEVSSRKIYGTRRKPGTAISELEKRGLIEKRIFHGERGRGGKIVRTRICYERDVVKRIVNYNVVKYE